MLNLGLYHPAWFLGLCGVLILNAYVIRRRRRLLRAVAA